LVRNWCRFAVKGGGHSRAVDASNSVGGVTIDMNKMNAIVPTQDRSRAKLGAGLTLGQVYKGLEKYGVSNVGGRVEGVGLAGFTMGGGFSSLGPRWGFAVDNVWEFEVSLCSLVYALR
jgi:FAD/FMN-containing dehydrogenase